MMYISDIHSLRSSVTWLTKPSGMLRTTDLISSDIFYGEILIVDKTFNCILYSKLNKAFTFFISVTVRYLLGVYTNILFGV